ncbi:MAG: hypothetical protein OXQ89_09450 [Rhodospirillaceae bacterium]|nr:hypothetical protein [Rhodospirillaceae bacterium]MDD9997955.1 hypothetical protein [Rhodospirillaceae bacterium]
MSRKTNMERYRRSVWVARAAVDATHSDLQAHSPYTRMSGRGRPSEWLRGSPNRTWEPNGFGQPFSPP